MSIKCGCGKGYANECDLMCRFCREKTISRAEAKKLGVRHRGDGIGFDEYYSFKSGRIPPVPTR